MPNAISAFFSFADPSGPVAVAVAVAVAAAAFSVWVASTGNGRGRADIMRVRHCEMKKWFIIGSREKRCKTVETRSDSLGENSPIRYQKH